MKLNVERDCACVCVKVCECVWVCVYEVERAKETKKIVCKVIIRERNCNREKVLVIE